MLAKETAGAGNYAKDEHGHGRWIIAISRDHARIVDVSNIHQTIQVFCASGYVASYSQAANQ